MHDLKPKIQKSDTKCYESYMKFIKNKGTIVIEKNKIYLF